MATEATVTVPAETFPFGIIFEASPGVEVELERIVPDADVIIPYFWVRGVPPTTSRFSGSVGRRTTTVTWTNDRP